MCDYHNKDSECRCKVERIPNFAQPRMLLELAKKPAHGYELIERLSQEGSPSPDPGNFYKMLRSLEEEGLVKSTWDMQNTGPARRVYELTDLGVELLHAWAVSVKHTHQSLNLFLTDYETLFPK